VTDYRFDEAKSFDENFEAFLEYLTAAEPDMAQILREHAGLLASVVRDGERDAKKRGVFNTSILAALDAALTAKKVEESA
jgi:hypothetical protein